MALVPFYKALADKFGRKPFLVLNTLGMGVGMALAWWSPNMVLYFIGYGMTVFFVQHTASDRNCRFDEYLYYNKRDNSAAKLFFEEYQQSISI